MVAVLFGCSTYVGAKLGLTVALLLKVLHDSKLPSRTDSEDLAKIQY
jgi:hypothetical protein